MTTIRFIYKSFWRAGTILTQSSEYAQAPAENTQDDIMSLAWNSRHGSGSGNGNFVVSATNKYIDFDEGGAELTATLTTGSYTAQTLVAEIKTKMDAAGGTYTVSYSETTGKFTILRGAGNYTLRWLSGTNTANSAAIMLGFPKTDKTGTNTYTSDNVTIHTSEYIDCDFGSALEYDFVAIINHNLTSSAVIKIYGADDSAFTTNVVTDTLTYNANNIYEFLAASRTKRYVRFYVEDVSNPSMYLSVGVVFVGKYFAPNRNFGPYVEGEIDQSEIEYSESMNLFTVQEKPMLINWELPFRGLNAASIASIRLMMQNNGITKALIICFDSTAANLNSYLVHFAELNKPECEQYNYYTWSANLEEVI